MVLSFGGGTGDGSEEVEGLEIRRGVKNVER